MAKVWVLDTETKGTGANVVPLDRVERRPDEAPERPARKRKRPAPAKRPGAGPGQGAGPRARPGPAPERERTATALPPGHVRKKATGELGKVLAVDSRAGTATVQWLKRGATSTVPLSAISRK